MDSPLLQEQATDLDMMVDQYDRVLQQLLDQYAPKKKRLVRPSAQWYTSDVVAEKRKRRRLDHNPIHTTNHNPIRYSIVVSLLGPVN